MLPLLALALGTVAGFVGSRKLRRPQRAAQAASVARSVSASVGRRKDLTAPELQRACFSEMVRHVRVGRDGRSIAPARYLLQLHPDDLAIVDETRSWFVDGVVGALRQAAADNGWLLEGDVDIRFEADATRRPGAPNALATDPGTPAEPPPVAPARPATTARPTSLGLRRTDTGDRTVLADQPVTVGRASERTIVIDDTRVSRSHATFGRGRSGWTVTDEGSSNGTTLNGRLLTPNVGAPITVGDTVGIGPIEIEVIAGPARRTPGTRALDDSDRTRISGEVLPPSRRPRP